MNPAEPTAPVTTIIGAGLCGLATAYRLQQAGINVRVLEANPFSGGRIQPAGDVNGHQDLGPTWVWPYAQPVIRQWIDELDVTLFEQFDTGMGLLDISPDQFASQQLLPSQHGSERIEGGTHVLIRQLEKRLPGVVQFEHVVTRCEQHKNRWQLTVQTPTDSGVSRQLTTDRLIISTPPRLAAAMLQAENDAPDISHNDSLKQALSILQRAETWMSPHAKVVAFYETAFWREAGMSGRIASHVGPLVEVHDHCGPDGTPAALFGFSGVPANARAEAGDQFVEAIKQQLQRCFGEQAPQPLHILVKDWAFEPFTTTEADLNGNGAHPPVLGKQVRAAHCNNSLWFACSETAAISAGLIEGALARADDVANGLIQISRGGSVQ